MPQGEVFDLVAVAVQGLGVGLEEIADRSADESGHHSGDREDDRGGEVEGP